MTDFEEVARAIAPEFETKNAPSKKKSESKSTAVAHPPTDPKTTTDFEEFVRAFEPSNAPSTKRSKSKSKSKSKGKSEAVAPPPAVPETTTNFEDFIRAFEAGHDLKNPPSTARSKRSSTVAAHPHIDPKPTTNFEEFVHQDFETDSDATNTLSKTVPGSKSPAAADPLIDLKTSTNSEEFVRPVEVEVEIEASTKSSLSAAEPSIPGSTLGQECSIVHDDSRWRWLSRVGAGAPRSPDAGWEEVEAALFRQDERAKSKNGIDIERSSTEDEWEAFCTAKANTTKTSHVLSYCWTVEDYFRAIELDSNLKFNRDVREAMARDKWVAWFRELEKRSGQRAPGSPPLAVAEIPKLAHPELREKWEKLTPLARDSRWPSVITKCLNTWPEGLPLVIAATVEQRIARPYMLEDVIRLLGKQIHYFKDPQRFADSVVDSLLSVLSRTTPGSVEVAQRTVYKIMRFASTPQVYELYTGLKKCGWRISLDTKMQFASRFAKDLRYRLRSVEVLRDMVEEDNFDINSLEGAALATSMLAIKNESPNNATRKRSVPAPEVNEEVHNMLLGLGLRPNVINLTAIIQAMCEIGQLEKAWEVFELMQSMGIEPDEQVFLTLLHGCKIRAHYGSAERVVGLVIEHGIHHRAVWNEVLHMIFLAAARSLEGGGRRVLPIFPAMCYAYNKFFHQEPLQRFMITDIKHHSLEISGKSGPPDWLWPLIRRSWRMISALPNREPMQPGIDTVYIMLKGYIRGFARPSSIVAFYTHIQELLKTGDPLAVGFVRVTGPKLHNLIIKALCGHQSMLRFALDIVSNMLKDSIQARRAAAAAGRIPEEDDQVLLHPAPDIRTWGILHRGFIAHMRYREADEILVIMGRHGTSPNLKIFHQLLAAFIRSKQTAEALNVMVRIQQAGLAPDGYTRMYARRLLTLLGKEDKTPEMMQLLNNMAQSQDSEQFLGEVWEDAGDNPDPADEGQITDEGQLQKDALDEYQQLEAELGQAVSGTPRSLGATVDPSVWAES